MPVAVGIYLPFSLAVPILLGGIINALFSKKSESEGSNRGVLIASGLIAGEALTGIAVAAIVFIIKTDEFPALIKNASVAKALGVLAFFAVAAMLAYFARPASKPNLEADKPVE